MFTCLEIEIVWCCFRFRRQHEQLRQVIVRVLRPAAKPARPSSPMEKKADVMKEAIALEAADANAIEVRLFLSPSHSK